MSRAYHMIEALHTPKFQPINTIVGLWTCPTCVVKILGMRWNLASQNDISKDITENRVQTQIIMLNR